MRRFREASPLLIALALLLLLPLSMDTVFRWEAFGYHLRLSYLSFGALLACAALDAPTRAKYLRLPLIRTLAFLVPIGLVGTLGSFYPQRSLAFTFWTTGTILGAPLIALFLVDRFGALAYRALAVYAVFQAAVVFSDSMTCFLPGHPTIGNAVIYVDYNGCRPHAFYREPNYLGAFILLLYPTLRAAMGAEKSRGWRAFLGWSCVAMLLATVLSTSKTGILGMVWLLAVEAAFFVKGLAGRRRAKRTPAPRKTKRLAPVLVSLALVAGAGGAILRNGYFLQGMWETLNFKSRNGTNDRRVNALVATEIVPRKPWFGVGPGGTGAWLAAHWDEITPSTMPFTAYYFEHVEPFKRDFKRLRPDPFYWNAFSEVLTEWGLLGGVAFFGGLVLLVFLGQGLPFWLLGGSLLAVCCTWQTIARMDLWICLSFYAAGWLLELFPVREKHS